MSMTQVITRSPLEPLSMASSQQNTRRKSSRLLDTDDDAPPPKRTKIDDVAADKGRLQSSGRKVPVDTRQTRAGMLPQQT